MLNEDRGLGGAAPAPAGLRTARLAEAIRRTRQGSRLVESSQPPIVTGNGAPRGCLSHALASEVPTAVRQELIQRWPPVLDSAHAGVHLLDRLPGSPKGVLAKRIELGFDGLLLRGDSSGDRQALASVRLPVCECRYTLFRVEQ